MSWGSQPVTVWAAPIAEYTYTERGPVGGDSGQLFGYFAVCTPEVFPLNCGFFSDPISFPVFEDLPMTAADIGRTIFVSVDESSVAEGAAGLLTNGLDDPVNFGLDVQPDGPSIGFMESTWFAGNPFSTNGVDLEGIPIQLFGMRLDSFEVSGTSWSAAVTTLVFVPEPSTALLFASGLVALAATRRRR